MVITRDIDADEINAATGGGPVRLAAHADVVITVTVPGLFPGTAHRKMRL